MNKKEERSREAYNRMALNYSETAEGQYTAPFKQIIAREAVIPANGAVLDMGCGPGELLEMLNKKCPIQGTGVDISDEMIRVAKARYPQFSFSVSSCAPLPFETGTFDAVSVSAAFHHFPEPRQFAAEAYRVLKKGGRIYVTDPFYPPLLRLLANTIYLPLHNAGDVKIYTGKELQRIFASAGFSDISLAREGNVQLLKAVKAGI